ncbi:hypothetical protein GRI38_04235 [Altererythrobacter aurantiacus]|uniref:Uncharacterized protein n=1 Tax=Parapontixanthobacter aurantiacus TaxID=1463599 RepID=A0A844Z9G4_9SPHN|nr:hypothetical protein [Parapontixanthobacter aurantiacus]MXO85231.1 hypothetical protein [Parapontixanthobacter aurantiacus]
MTAPLDEFYHALQPWDGRWFVKLPDAGPRLLTLTQHTALQILRGRTGLTNWDARLLQTIATTEGELSSLQRHYLDRLAREHDERVTA